VAGAELKVAKHGNRSMSGLTSSSLCGSADVVEALGVNLELTPAQVAQCIDEVGIGFLYAPLLHTAMKHVMAARREIGVRTVFNLLGPLTNPAGARAQVIGVADPSKLETLAAAAAQVGTERALVVSSADGLDEFSVSGTTRVVELKDGELATYDVSVEEIGIEPADDGAVGAGSPEENARVLRGVLEGEDGTERSLALVNGAAAIYVAGRADTLQAGVELARESIDSGAALRVMQGFVEQTR
jgi:anthranilate phosphoribosyltransferase